jgi:hypothetical protein
MHVDLSVRCCGRDRGRLDGTAKAAPYKIGVPTTWVEGPASAAPRTSTQRDVCRAHALDENLILQLSVRGEQAERLIREIDLEGYSEVEFRRDGNDIPYLMEINPRLSASVEIAVRCGVDFPHLLYQW